MAYYNTTRQKGEQLKVSWKKTKSQDDKVMEYFYEHGKGTPSEVWIYFRDSNVPITSIRRSITNLLALTCYIRLITKKKVFMVDLNMFGKYIIKLRIGRNSMNDDTRFYIYISSMLGFLLGVVVTILIISTEHQLF